MKYVFGESAELQFFDGGRTEIPTPANNDDCPICGISDTNENVILLGAGLRKSAGSWKLDTRASVVNALFEYYDGWMGECKFRRKSEVVFDKVAVRLNNLEQWWGTTPAHLQCTPQPAHYTGWIDSSPPAPLEVFADETVSITVAWTESVSQPAKGMVQTRVTLDCVPEIIIESKKGKMPFYGKTHSFSYWIGLCRDWFGLLIGRHVLVLDCWGFSSQSDGLPPGTQTSRRLVRQDADEERAKLVPQDQIRFPYEVIRDMFRECTARFFDLPHEVHDFAGRLIYQQQTPDVIPTDLIPNQVFIFEGLSNNLYSEYIKDYQRKHKGEHPSLFDRFKNVWEDLKPLYRVLESVADPLFGDFVEKRDAWGHGRDAGVEDRNWSLDICEAIWMWTFLSAMILFKSGVPLPVIATCLERLEWEHRNVRTRLHGLLSVHSRENLRSPAL